MESFTKREPLRLLTKIVQLFSLTKNLNREQWKIVYKELWSTVVRDISILFEEHPLTQVWFKDRSRNNQLQILANSSALATMSNLDEGARLSMAEKGCLFDLDDDHFLYIEIPFNNLSEEQKMLLQAIIEHLRISQEWRDSLERGFEFQRQIDLLHKITTSIRGSLELSDVLAVTAHDVGESLKVSRCFIRRYDPNIPGRVLATEQEFCETGLGKAADIIFDFETEWMKELTTQSEAAISQGQEFPQDGIATMLYIDNIDSIEDTDGLVKSLAQAINLKSFLGVPLIYKSIVLGSLCLHQCDSTRHFRKHELDFIRQVADEATVAIVHAQMYAHIQKQAKTDSLTGLHNKASFFETLNLEVERARRTGGNLAVMMLDLDFLKRANDTYGHMVGDETIKILGVKLRQIMRQTDLVARFGGDEFGVILPDTSLEGAKVLAQRLVDLVLSTTHPLAGQLSASIGVSGTPITKINPDVLVEEADRALYLAKRRGKGRCAFADDPDMNDEDKTAGKPASPSQHFSPIAASTLSQALLEYAGDEGRVEALG